MEATYALGSRSLPAVASMVSLIRLSMGGSADRRALDQPEELPGTAEALELVHPGVLEFEVGPVDEVHDGRRDEDLIGAGDSHDPRRRVDGDAAQVVSRDLDFAGGDPCADPEA